VRAIFGVVLSKPHVFRITGINHVGELGDASRVRLIPADLRGDLVAVHADAAAASTPAHPALDAGDGNDTFRERRLSRLAEGRRRHEILSAAAPSADPQFINVIAAADRFWGPDEQWREALRSQRTATTGHESASAGPVDSIQPPTVLADALGLDSKPPRGHRRRWPSLSHLFRPHQEPTPAGNADEESAFDVPLPGRSPRKIGRGRSWVTRLAIIGAPLVLIGGVAYSCGVSTGSARLVQSSAISSQDANAFHLSAFPADRAAAVGVSYLSLCWTHPDATDTVATTDRLAALARMSSAGVTPGCGWNGTTASAPPLSVTWDGNVKPVQGTYANGAAAQLGFVVTSADGRTVGATLPIWVSSTTATSAGVRIVGEMAVVPIPPAAAAPTPAAPPLTDSTIAESLTISVLVPFLRAWAVSDPVQLNLVLARDASAAARAGMAGQVTAPAINRTQVVVTRGDPKGYRDGDTVTAQTGVDWTTRMGGIQHSGYSIVLRMTAGRWQVIDITGAAPDPAGGAAAATTFASTPTAPAAG